jgi:hypothetical protein
MLSEYPTDRVGSLEVHRVASPGDDHDLGPGDPARHLGRDRPELLVALADHEQDRHRQIAQPIP